MNRRLLNILLIAFAIAAGCSYIVFRLVGSRLSGTRQTTTRVIAAATDIKLGSVLRDADLTTIEITGTLPKGAILKKEQVIGRGVISNLYLGEPILESRLAAPGSGGGLAATIPQGMRATAVRVNEVVGVAGFVTPGMRVDVLITGNPPGVTASTGQGSLVRTLLQNIEVLSAGTDIQRDAEGKPLQVQVVNLLVTPTQAEILSLASSETHIQLVLRNPLDTKLDQPPGTATAQLFTNSSPPKVVATGHRVVSTPASPRVYLVEVFNGSKKSETKFAAGEDKDKEKQ
jgi:pilus assembly protein CpaB